MRYRWTGDGSRSGNLIPGPRRKPVDSRGVNRGLQAPRAGHGDGTPSRPRPRIPCRLRTVPPHGHRQRAVWVAGRRPGAARATRPGGRRSGPTCPAGASPGGDVRSPPRSILRLATPGLVRFRSCGCPRARPPPAGRGRARRPRRSLRQSRARRLPIISVAMVAPLGAVNSRACVSRCVSPPTTASTTSANIGMRPRISFQARVCWVGAGLSGVTERHICDGSRAPWHGQASNQANRWPGRCRRCRGQVR